MLRDFCNYMNDHIGGEGPIELPTDWDYGKAIEGSLRRHYEDDRQKDGLRISGMGKPAVLQALAKLGYTEVEPRGRMRWIFHLGDIFELFIGVMLKHYGVEVIGDQMEDEATFVETRGVGGHYDYTIRDGDDEVLVEVKTMSENYARQFRRNPDDERGYVTQLAMYWDALGRPPAIWLCLDKGKNEVFTVEPSIGELEAALHRVDLVLPRLAEVKELDDILRVFKAPPPVPEGRKHLTGEYLLPGNMKWSPFAPAFYDYDVRPNRYGRDTKYVNGYRDSEGMKEVIGRLLKDGSIAKKES